MLNTNTRGFFFRFLCMQPSLVLVATAAAAIFADVVLPLKEQIFNAVQCLKERVYVQNPYLWTAEWTRRRRRRRLAKHAAA